MTGLPSPGDALLRFEPLTEGVLLKRYHISLDATLQSLGVRDHARITPLPARRAPASRLVAFRRSRCQSAAAAKKARAGSETTQAPAA